MSGLTERQKTRIQAAMGRALTERGVLASADRGGVVAAVIEALDVLAEEFGPRPEDAAPPVRELPTEPGAVVLIEGTPWWRDRAAWSHVGSDGIVRACFPSEVSEADWLPATVVPTAVHEAAVKALRDVVALLHGPQSGDAQEAQDAARKALAGVEGWAGL